jgi:hypothetical protein
LLKNSDKAVMIFFGLINARSGPGSGMILPE